MNSGNWALAALNTTAFLLCVSFLVYLVFILRPFLRRRDGAPSDRADYQFHFVVPCLDEESVVADTVRHLADAFPYATVWVVDDGSVDATPEILEELQEELASLRVVTRRPPEAGQGKGAALNAAWSAIDAALGDDVDRHRVVVGVIDADSRLERTAPDVLCAYLADPRVGAVQVQVRVTSDIDAMAGSNLAVLADLADRPARQDPLLVQLQDLEFTGPIAAMQCLRRRTGSVGMGGNGQFTRLEVLDRIATEHGTPWHGSLLEDFELGLHVLLTGARTEYCDETFVAQTGLVRLAPLLRQRSRWAQGGMQCLRYLGAIMCSPQVSLSGAVEIAYYLWVPWSQLLGSIVFPLVALVQLHYALHTGDGVQDWWSSGAWGLLPLGVLFGMGPQAIWGPVYRGRVGATLSWRRAVCLGLLNVVYAYLLQLAVWWALVRIVRRRTDWKKTAHHGAVPSPAAPARPAPAAAHFAPPPVHLMEEPGRGPVAAEQPAPAVEDGPGPFGAPVAAPAHHAIDGDRPTGSTRRILATGQLDTATLAVLRPGVPPGGRAPRPPVPVPSPRRSVDA